MTTTSISIRITESRGPVRRRVNIPQSDVKTQDWWDAQGDVSTSLRLLVLEEVAAHGIVDRVNRTGSRRVQAAVPVQAATPVATAHLGSPFVSAVPPIAAVPVTPVAPVAPAIPADPKDAVINELNARIAALQDAMSPFLTFRISPDDDLVVSPGDQDDKPIVTVLGTGSAA
ncbi:hypothetical protein [Cryobacterium zhongshanensis]|uniref:Uncharacterized protein n=1 Tax=Cryobacterium zhongshanensis TaxID=2928153 RepID=A0AA41UIP0_9MICO|nr:hypothetical protein [Cryobacterium zhongshanensis]MCI4659754.1 hypothetical protein [Cryobacterium zhongshanensis]